MDSRSHINLKIAHWNINGLFRRHENYCKLSDPVSLNK